MTNILHYPEASDEELLKAMGRPCNGRRTRKRKEALPGTMWLPMWLPIGSHISQQDHVLAGLKSIQSQLEAVQSQISALQNNQERLHGQKLQETAI